VVFERNISARCRERRRLVERVGGATVDGVAKWLLKSEPDVFGYDDLVRNKREGWDGVRNYQARNFMRDDMKPGDQVLYYHSGANPPHVAGTAVVVREAYPDHTSWDKKSDHFDPKSTQQEPRWFMVDIQLQDICPEILSLEELRQAKPLADMVLLQRGSRLSVQPVTKAEFETVLKLAKAKAKQAK
jgi:predicted RNA-binding protein with PUA-like domain